MTSEENKDSLEEVKKFFDEKTEETKKYFDEKTEETKRHMGVLIEEVHSKIDLLAEGQSSLREKVDLLVEDMDYVKSEIIEIKDRFKENDGVIAAKADQKIVDNHETRIVKLENTVLAKAA